MRTQSFGELLQEDPNAFLLLSAIAYRIDRDGRGSYHGCKIGEAVVNYSCCGLSKQKYRTAKNNLAIKGMASFEVRGKGKHKRTYARLLSKEIYDINLPDEIHPNSTGDYQYINRESTYKQNNLTDYKQKGYAEKLEKGQQTKNRQTTIKQHDTNDKQEIRKNKKEEKNSNTTIDKDKFAQEEKKRFEDQEAMPAYKPCYNVYVENETHEMWLKSHGEVVVEKAYNVLSHHKKGKGKENGHILEDTAAMHRWCIQAAQEELLKEREIKAREKKVQQMEKQMENPTAYWLEKNQEKIDFMTKLRDWIIEPLAIVQWNEKGSEVGRHRQDPLYKPLFISFSHPDFQNAVINHLKKEGVFKGQGEWQFP